MKKATLVRLALGTAAAAAMLAVIPNALAFRMIQNNTVGRVSAGAAVTCNAAGGFAHWVTANIPWRLNTAGQGSEPGMSAALTAAAASWANVGGANHTPTYAGTTTEGFTTDGVNTVVFAKGNGCNGTCLAITALVLQAGQVIVETDVSFNSRYNWNTNGSNYDFQATCTHEFGHALGIHHTELTGTPRPTMYAAYFGTDGRSLETDDAQALQCAQSRYPVSP